MLSRCVLHVVPRKVCVSDCFGQNLPPRPQYEPRMSEHHRQVAFVLHEALLNLQQQNHTFEQDELIVSESTHEDIDDRLDGER